METLSKLVSLAQQQTLAKICYRKPGEQWVTERLVEPYSLTYSGPNLIVLTWQVDPVLDEPAWRNFRCDRITKVESANLIFNPRIPITLHTGEANVFIFNLEPNAGKSHPSIVEQYFKHVEAALFDGKLTDQEIKTAQKIRSNLCPQRTKAIHAMIYASIIGEITADGKIDEVDEQRLQAMRVWLSELGWCP